jgi:hypothetical protein
MEETVNIRHIVQFLLLLVFLAACGETKTPQPTDPSPTDPSPTDPFPTDTTPPSPPLWVTITPGDGQVALRWQANSEAGLEHYVLYWGTESGNLPDLEEIGGTLTEHIVTGLSNGTNYFFALTAVDKDGNVSNMSTEVTATPEALPEPPAPPAPAEGDFSVSALGTLSIQKGQGKQLLFSIARNNFPDEVSLTLETAPEGVSSDLPKSTAGDELVATITVENSAAISAGDYTLEFAASSGGLSKTLEVALTVTEAPAPPPAPEPPTPELPQAEPEIDSVMLEGFGGSKQVRQGYGNITLTVVGNHLGTISEAKLETSEDGVTDSLPVSIQSKTDTTLTLQTTVQHGSKQGDYILSLSNGTMSKDSLGLVVTSIVAGPTGNDGTGRGTQDSPFRSLTKAVSMASHEDFISLAAGEYNIANGEDFPLNVLGMKISGAGRDATTISGAGSTTSCLNVVGSGADAVITGLEVTACDGDGIRLEDGKTSLLSVRLRENQDNGLTLTGTAEATVSHSDFVANADNGIRVQNRARLTFNNNVPSVIADNGSSGLYIMTFAKLTGNKLLISSNGNGIRLSGSQVEVSLQESSLTENTGHGILIEDSQQVNLSNVNVLNSGGHGIYVTGNTEMTWTQGQGNVNNGDGINVNVAADEIADVSLNDVTLSGNDESGIEYRSANTGSKLSMVESTLSNNGTYGLYLAGKPSAISLGHLKPANNMFIDNGSTYLVDARDANSGPITAYGTNFANGGLLTDVTGVKNGSDSAPPFWQIVNVGNTIDFGAAE